MGKRGRHGLQLWHLEPEGRHLSFHTNVREYPKSILKLIQIQILGMRRCDFSWPRSATEGLWVVVLVGHVGKGQEEPWRKAKVGPRRHG